MIEIDIPSIDPLQHEPKIFLGMSSRQILCLVPGLIVGVALFVATYQKSMDTAVVLTGLSVAPAVCFGWLKPYNMKFEQYIKLWYFNTFVANQKRIYKTDLAQEQKLLTIKEREELEKKQKEKELAEKKKNKENKKSKKGLEG